MLRQTKPPPAVKLLFAHPTSKTHRAPKAYSLRGDSEYEKAFRRAAECEAAIKEALILLASEDAQHAESLK
jgi:hypothetical protein